MGSLENLERARRPVRNDLKQSIKELEDAMKVKPVELGDVEAALYLMDEGKIKLEELNTKIMEAMLAGNKSDADIDKECEAVRNLQKMYIFAKNKASKLFTVRVEEDHASFVSAAETQKRKIRLPIVELKKFGGDLKQWLSWWTQFQKIHTDGDLDDADKFYYLVQYMEPGSEAQQLIESYPQTAGNYSKAVGALEQRYGRHDLLLQVYVRELLTLVISNATNKEKLPLPQLHVKLESHLRSLSELKLNHADPATWLFPLVESSLSEETLRAWQRSDYAKQDGTNLDPPKTRLDFLMDFIQSEVRCEQQISLAQSGFQSKPEVQLKRGKKGKVRFASEDDVATAAGLLAATHVTKDGCVFCGNKHASDRCIAAQAMTLGERKKIVHDKEMCYVCLAGKHYAKKCKTPVKCILCGKKHYPIMCPVNAGLPKESADVRKDIPPVTDNTPPSQASTSKAFSASASLECSSEILLNTLVVDMEGDGGRKYKVRLVGDTGSQRSWIKSSTASAMKCKPIGEEYILSVLFGGGQTCPKRHEKYSINLSSSGGDRSFKLEVLENKIICGNIPKVQKGVLTEELARYGILHSDVGFGSTDVDILIGSDYWGSLLTGKLIKLPSGLVAVETTLGWTVSGRAKQNLSMMYLSLLTTQQDVSQLWSLEALGIRDPIERKIAQDEEEEALKQFTQSVKRDTEGRYVVALPWKTGHNPLPSNRNVAEKRLKSSTRKLEQQGQWGNYDNVFKSWEKEKLISTVKNYDDSGHFLPHRPVFKEGSSTPIRPVFDASAKVAHHPSLNECLYKGPILIELIPTLLLRFREKGIGVSADIRKAFMMIKVRDEDRSFQKFLWWEGADSTQLKVYQHNRVVFGVTSSPFLLAAVIQHHFESTVSDESLRRQLKESFYVDNCIFSMDTAAECETFKIESVRILAEAGMDLRQWMSTMREDRELLVDGNIQPTEVSLLGLAWNRKDDTLSCTLKDVEVPGKVTKRIILSIAAQVFDPIGVLCPALLVPKMLIQEAWALKCSWDEPVPEEYQRRFTKWMKGMSILKEVCIPRHYELTL